MTQVPCWNCPPESGNTMKQIAVDAFYRYHQCQTCGVEQMVLREDRPKLAPEYQHLLIKEES